MELDVLVELVLILLGSLLLHIMRISGCELFVLGDLEEVEVVGAVGIVGMAAGEGFLLSGFGGVAMLRLAFFDGGVLEEERVVDEVLALDGVLLGGVRFALFQ